LNNTSIEWCTQTWNPVRGCTRVSKGCMNCFAEVIAGRFSGKGLAFEGFATRTPAGGRWTNKVALMPGKLAEPFSMRQPELIFVNSMSDLFHEDLGFSATSAIFGVMAACPQHTFQILTKRPQRALEYFAWLTKRGEDGKQLFPDDPEDWRIRQLLNVSARRAGADMNPDARQNHGGPWPLPNVWIGVSVEDQETADERIPQLLRIPAALRFVSYEPALAGVNFSNWLFGRVEPCANCPRDEDCNCGFTPRHQLEGEAGLHWIIVGGESGNEARPFDLAWAREVIYECGIAEVPVFVKQLGSHPMTRLSPSAELALKAFGGRGQGRLEPMRFRSRKGGDVTEWPAGLAVRQIPSWPGQRKGA